MKIRHKRTGLALDIRGEVDEWELLPDNQTEPRWQDVTEECEVDKWNGLHHGKEVIFGMSKQGYRLQKVQLMQHVPFNPGNPADVWAFFVERKETE